MVSVRTELPHPAVVTLLDGLCPSRRRGWKAPDGWRLDRTGSAEGVDVRHDWSGLRLRCWSGTGPQTVQLLTVLLRHDGAASCADRPVRDFAAGWRDGSLTFDLLDFEAAVRAGGDPLDTLTGGPAETPAELGWGVVANVAGGTRLFAPDAKVWMSSWFNGADDRRWVVGRHRRSGRYIRAIVDSGLLRGPRPKALHSPAVLRLMESVAAAFLADRPDPRYA